MEIHGNKWINERKEDPLQLSWQFCNNFLVVETDLEIDSILHASHSNIQVKCLFTSFDTKQNRNKKKQEKKNIIEK